MAGIDLAPAGFTRRAATVLKPMGRWVGRNPLVALTILAAIAAAEAWAALDGFYRHFAVSPQETGVTAELQSVIAGVLLAVLLFVVVVVLTFLVLATVLVSLALLTDGIRILWGIRRRDDDAADHLRRRWRKLPESIDWLVGLLVFTTIGVVVWTLLFLLPQLASDDARRAESGRAVGGEILGPFFTLPDRAIPVQVTTTTKAISLDASHCLLLLGSADGITILVDVTDGRTLRVPSASVQTAEPLTATTPGCTALAAHAPAPAPQATLDLYRWAGGMVFISLGSALLAVGALVVRRHPRTGDQTTEPKPHHSVRSFGAAVAIYGVAGLVPIGILVLPALPGRALEAWLLALFAGVAVAALLDLTRAYSQA